MSNTLLSDLRPAICEQIKEVLPQLQTCKPHEGKFDLKELKKSGIHAPGVLVSMLGMARGQAFAGGPAAPALRMAAFIVTRDGMGVPRDVAALNILQAVWALVERNVWGNAALDEPEKMAAHCLTTVPTRDIAASLWAITWEQKVSFFEPPEGGLGAALYVAQVPEGDTASAGDFEQIGGSTDGV